MTWISAGGVGLHPDITVMRFRKATGCAQSLLVDWESKVKLFVDQASGPLFHVSEGRHGFRSEH